jgi:hypothetical protein
VEWTRKGKGQGWVGKIYGFRSGRSDGEAFSLGVVVRLREREGVRLRWSLCRGMCQPMGGEAVSPSPGD